MISLGGLVGAVGRRPDGRVGEAEDEDEDEDEDLGQCCGPEAPCLTLTIALGAAVSPSLFHRVLVVFLSPPGLFHMLLLLTSLLITCSTPDLRKRKRIDGACRKSKEKAEVRKHKS